MQKRAIAFGVKRAPKTESFANPRGGVQPRPQGSFLKDRMRKPWGRGCRGCHDSSVVINGRSNYNKGNNSLGKNCFNKGMKRWINWLWIKETSGKTTIQECKKSTSVRRSKTSLHCTLVSFVASNKRDNDLLHSTAACFLGNAKRCSLRLFDQFLRTRVY